MRIVTGAEADESAAREANAAFYAAFRQGDLEAMDALWARDEPVLCAHPGGGTIHGRIAVIASWHSLFTHGPPPIDHSDDRVTIIRGMAFVSCVEHIADRRLGATNVFVWEQGRWRLVLHSAGLLSQDDESIDPGSTSGLLH